MTIKQARKILGPLATNLSDEDVLKDIKTADVLKNLFFNKYTNNGLPQKNYNNVNVTA